MKRIIDMDKDELLSFILNRYDENIFEKVACATCEKDATSLYWFVCDRCNKALTEY